MYNFVLPNCRHILQSDHKKRYAVIVNDMSEINVDEKLIQPFIQHQVHYTPFPHTTCHGLEYFFVAVEGGTTR